MLLLIDNYDSFTYNLVNYLAMLDMPPVVQRNDSLSLEQTLARNPAGIMISPGPCDPDKAGISLDLIHAAAERHIPVLGVCLGHQSIGQAFGGKVIRAPKPMHGKISLMHHHQQSVFKGLETPFPAARYHSLIVEKDSLPSCLDITAWTDDDLIMGLQHKTLPIHGVQFHPESIASQHGHDLLKNFIDLLPLQRSAA